MHPANCKHLSCRWIFTRCLIDVKRKPVNQAWPNKRKCHCNNKQFESITSACREPDLTKHLTCKNRMNGRVQKCSEAQITACPSFKTLAYSRNAPWQLQVPFLLDEQLASAKQDRNKCVNVTVVHAVSFIEAPHTKPHIESKAKASPWVQRLQSNNLVKTNYNWKQILLV